MGRPAAVVVVPLPFPVPDKKGLRVAAGVDRLPHTRQRFCTVGTPCSRTLNRVTGPSPTKLLLRVPVSVLTKNVCLF